MFTLTEAEIMAGWPENEPVCVSVCCITYKQEQYIAQAIDSFLMQKTTFPFEIIIGEDHGGDKTIDILLEYRKHYPNIIKIVLSDHNVGANRNLLRVFDMAKGKYIAVCEGDDFWICHEKLSRQFFLMEKYRSYDFLVSNALFASDNGELTKEFLVPIASGMPLDDGVCVVELDSVLSCHWQFAATASYFFRKSALSKLPFWFKDASIGDLYLEIYLGSSGILVEKSFTVAYRIATSNSWSSTISKQNFIKISHHYDDMILRLTYVIEDIPRYKYAANKKINDCYFSKANSLLKNKQLLSFIKEMKCVRYSSDFSIKRKIIYILCSTLNFIR